MKITICGSSAFHQEMVNYKGKLEQMGHKIIVHPHYIQFAEKSRINGENAQAKKENDYIRWYYKAIKKSDAVLILNFDKKGVKNYIGGNTLMEIGFAHANNKKVFLLNDIPEKGVSYTDEIKVMTDFVLKGDLNKINYA